MSIILQNRETLAQLFSTFSLQEALLVNQNLTASWTLLSTPPAQLLEAMEKKQVNIEHFLGKKCIPLIRFYLSDTAQQKETFLSVTLLSQLFISLPAVEATIFKQHIQRAQHSVLQTNQALATLLTGKTEALAVEVDSVVRFNDHQSLKKQQLTLLAEGGKQYFNHFYFLQAGELFIADEGDKVDVDMLLYSELSPLQQLQAQKLCQSVITMQKTMQNADAEPQSVSA